MPQVPPTNTYVLAQVDIEATLRGVSDADVYAQIQTLQPLQCILYLNQLGSLFYNSRACTYQAFLIGPGARPPNPERCLTPDMCIPIRGPNGSHTSTRPALRTEPAFPLSDCCHWTGPDMEREVRIALSDVDFGERAGSTRRRCPRTLRRGVVPVQFLLPSAEYVRMDRMRWEDKLRARHNLALRERREREEAIRALQEKAKNGTLFHDLKLDIPQVKFRRSRRRASRQGASELSPVREESSPPFSDTGHGPSLALQKDTTASAEPQPEGDNLSDVPSSWCSESSYGELIQSVETSSQSLHDCVYDENPGCLPTLRIWTDLAAHVKDWAIPDPIAFIQHYDAITQILTKDTTAPIHSVRYEAEIREDAHGGPHQRHTAPLTNRSRRRHILKRFRRLPKRALLAVRSAFRITPA